MRRRAFAAAFLVAAAALLPGCITVVGEENDPVYSEKLSQLERRMDRVEQGLPK
jgi:hypothetical protein